MAVKEQNKPKNYTDVLDGYFKRHPIEIRVIPDFMMQNIDFGYSDFEILSFNQYEEYLRQENEYWRKNDPDGEFEVFSNFRDINVAINRLESAKSLASNLNHHDLAIDELRESINCVNGRCLCSKTKVAEFLVTECKNKTSFFVEGVKAGMSTSRRNQAPLSIDGMAGFYAAMTFLDLLNNSKRVFQIELKKIDENIEIVNRKYTELNRKYSQSYRNYEQRMSSLKATAENQIADINKKTTEYFNLRDIRCKELEDTYTNKLRLEAPAEYWEKMEQDYKKKARFWVIMSVWVSVFTIVGLFFILSQLPNLFTEDSHWLDIFKNSAIFTIALSICVYILRLFVKLATSSFHLSRDAKERNKLSYFYLALIEKGAVSDKERAIILSALFSRADTGLLKGDSSPTMPNTVGDIVNGLTK